MTIREIKCTCCNKNDFQFLRDKDNYIVGMYCTHCLQMFEWKARLKGDNYDNTTEQL